MEIQMENAVKQQQVQFEKGHLGHSMINAMKSGHYNLASSMSELFDNSEDAGATQFYFDTIGPSKNIHELVIADNGRGMTAEELEGSFTLGLDRERDAKELGKFGCGGTVGMFNVAATKITLTNGPHGRFARKYDMEDIKANDCWGTSEMPWDSWMSEYMDKYLPNGETGTVIILRELEDSFSKVKANIAKVVENHVSTTYGEKIDVNDAVFKINGTPVKGYDPLHWYAGAERVVDETITVNGSIVRIRMVDLRPVVGNIPGNLIHNCGGYIYRNDRLIKGRITKLSDGYFSQFFERHADNRYIRWAVYYNGEIDDVMRVSFDKTTVNPSQSILDKISSIIIPDAKVLRKSMQTSKTNKGKDLLDMATAANLMKDSKKVVKHKLETNDVGGLTVVSEKTPDISDNKKAPSYLTIETSMGPSGEPYIACRNPDKDSPAKWLLKLNVDHRFCSSYWTNGTTEQRSVVMSIALATCFAQLELADDYNEDVERYRTSINQKLSKATTKLDRR